MSETNNSNEVVVSIKNLQKAFGDNVVLRDIVMNARTIVATTGSITPYVVAALFYLVITLPLARLVSGLEARLLGTAETKKKRPAKSAGQVVATPADHIAGL